MDTIAPESFESDVRIRDEFSALFDMEVEQSLLGCLIAEEEAFDQALNLREEYFYSAVHGRIFAAIQAKRNANLPFTAFSLAQEFAGDSDLQEIGRGGYIVELAQNVASTQVTQAHAQHIEAMHMRRMIKALGQRLVQSAERPDPGINHRSPAAHVGEAERLIREASVRPGRDRVKHISDCTDHAILSLKHDEAGIPTGIGALDELLRGFRKGQLCIVAGRPGMGKTALGLTLALNAALAQNHVLFNSLEMTRDDLTTRLLARLSGAAVHSGAAYDEAKLVAAAERLRRLPLYIDDTSGITVTEIATAARRQQRLHGLDILFIDYLGLIAHEYYTQSRVHQIEEITTQLKSLAKELDIPIILLCQLNRAVEQRDDKRPTLADLRDSGSIEQDADIVVFVYREEYYVRDAAPADDGYRNKNLIDAMPKPSPKGYAELIVAKLRQGRRGTATCRFDGERQVFHYL